MNVQKFHNILRCIGIGCLIFFCFILVIMPFGNEVLDYMIGVNLVLTFLSLLSAVVLPRKLSLIFSPALLLVTIAYRLSTHFVSLRLILLHADGGENIFESGGFILGGNFILGAIVFSLITLFLCLLIFKCVNNVRAFISYFGFKFKSLLENSGNESMVDSQNYLNELKDKIADDKYSINFENQRLIRLKNITKFIKIEAILSVILTFTAISGGYLIGTEMRGMPILYAIQWCFLLGFGDGFIFLTLSFLTALTTFVIAPRLLVENMEANKKYKNKMLIAKVFAKISLLIASYYLIIAFQSSFVYLPLSLFHAAFFGLITYIIWSFACKFSISRIDN